MTDTHGTIPRPVVGYTLSRFPKISETFILGELEALRREGTIDVALCPLRRERIDVMHPGAENWVRRARFAPLLAPRVLAANLVMLLTRPRRYLAALREALWGNRRSRRLLLGALSTWPRAVAMARHLDRLGARHLHCHFTTHPALAGLIVHRLVGIPFSFTAHGSDLHRDQTMLAEKVAAARFVIAISDDNRQVIEAHADVGSPSKVHVVHCGVDLSEFHPVRRERSDVLELTAIGTLHEVKGQRYLIEAVSELVAQGRSVRLAILGDGPDRIELEHLVDELGIGSVVEFRGRATQPEVIERLRETDVLVAASVPTADGRREGIPVVLMEAMASGVAVVASRLSGIPELVEHEVSGLLVEPGDVDGLAVAIARLDHDEGCRSEFARAARSRIEDEFDIDANARRLIDLFDVTGG